MKKDILIPAAINGTPGVYTENVSEPGFSIVSTTAGFQIVVGSQPAQSLASGMAVGVGSGPALGLVTFQNTTTSDVHVTIGDFSLARPTTIQATAGTFIGDNSQIYNFSPPGPSKTFPGTDANGFQRKSITVTNSGRASVGGATTDNVAWIAEPGSDLFIIIFPGNPPVTIESSADLEVGFAKADLTTGATSLAVAVMEVFYSKPLQTDQ